MVGMFGKTSISAGNDHHQASARRIETVGHRVVGTDGCQKDENDSSHDFTKL